MAGIRIKRDISPTAYYPSDQWFFPSANAGLGRKRCIPALFYLRHYLTRSLVGALSYPP
jgi:hypothetical protein